MRDSFFTTLVSAPHKLILKTEFHIFLVPEDLLLQTLPSVLVHQEDPEQKNKLENVIDTKLIKVFNSATIFIVCAARYDIC